MAAAAYFAAGPGSAQAATYLWTGGQDALFGTRSNWIPQGMPTAADTVYIPTNQSVVLNSDVTVASLKLDAGSTLINNGALTVLKSIDVQGLIAGAGAINIPNGASGNFSFGMAEPGMSMTNGKAAPVRIGRLGTPVVAFQAIKNKGNVQVASGRGVSLQFDSVENSGVAIINSTGPVTFKDVKNVYDARSGKPAPAIAIGVSGDATFANINNAPGSLIALSISSATLSTTAALKSTKFETRIDATATGNNVVLAAVDNKGKMLLKGEGRGGRAFRGKSIRNSGEMGLDGCTTILESDVINGPDATLTLQNDSVVQSSSGRGSKLENQGLIRKEKGGDAAVEMDWINKGRVVVEEGTLRLRPPAGKNSVQSAGSTWLEGGTLEVDQPGTGLPGGTYRMDGGTLNGAGTIDGNLVNSGGRVQAGHSPGIITINGNFTQAANGTLDMEIGGYDPGTGYDQLQVEGEAFMAGTLNLVGYGGFLPGGDADFQLMHYEMGHGQFDTINGLNQQGGRTYTTYYGDTYLLAQCWITTTPLSAALGNVVNNGNYQSLSTLTGTADGSDLQSVTVRFYRYANGATPSGYWAGGSTWTSTSSSANDLPATGNPNLYTWSFAPPPSLPTGRYAAFAMARDSLGGAAVSSTLSFWVDSTAPSAQVLFPINNLTYPLIVNATGTASDTGSGLQNVTCILYRLTNGPTPSGYWAGGPSWTSSYSAVNERAVTGTTAWTFLLPPLANGTYRVRATATDKVGNVTQSTVIQFTKGSGGTLVFG